MSATETPPSQPPVVVERTAAPPKAPGGPRRSQRNNLLRLTVSLSDTYRSCDCACGRGPAPSTAAACPQATAAPKKSEEAGFDDANGDYVVTFGERIGREETPARYELLGTLGKGSFGQVLRARDLVRAGEEVAVKIIKNRTLFYKQALIEVEVLARVNAGGSSCTGGERVVRMRESFRFRGHLCIVFELLSYNLYELLSITQFTGVSLHLIRKFAQQLLDALDLLSTSRVSVIHCDVKPENILLVNPKRSAVKLIDFGSSCAAGQTMYKYVQSRYYRSPEVILGLPYSFPIDVWSLGCILVEMHTGDPLFNGKNETEQLVKMAGVLGMPPSYMLEASPKVRKLVSRKPDLSFEFIPALQARVHRRSLSDILGVETGGPKGRRRGEPGHGTVDYLKFKDLIEKMLAYDPAKRITPLIALQHSFFKRTAEQSTSITPRRSPAPSPQPPPQLLPTLPTTKHPTQQPRPPPQQQAPGSIPSRPRKLSL